MILLTNDDGIGAAGLECARRFLEGIGQSVVVVAPDRPVSQCGHSITTDAPMLLREVEENIYALSGKPADCVRVGLRELLKETPSYVVSGMNYGANLGVDLYVSGTAAAAREGALLGVPSVALSLYHHTPVDLEKEFDCLQLARVWEQITAGPFGASGFWNVNFPHPVSSRGSAGPEIVRCEPSKTALPVAYLREGDTLRYSGKFNERERPSGSDVDLCFGGKITVSWVPL